MRDARPRRWSPRLPLTLALTLSSTAFAQTGEIPQAIQDEARRLIAERTQSSPDDIELVGSATVTYPLQGLTTYQFKGTSSKGDTAGVALDPNAKELSAPALDDREDSLRVERHGRLSDHLVETLARTAEDQELRVMLWARTPEGLGEGLARPEASKPLGEADVDRLFEQQQSWRKQVAAAATGPLVERLAALGAQAEVDELSPVVTVSLKPSLIREVARWDELVEADVAGTYQPFLDVSRATVEADIVNSWGITGNVRRAVIEVGGRAHTTNPYLPPVIQNFNFSCLSNHTTAVVGVIGSQHGTHRGIAPATSPAIYVGGDCGGFNSGLQYATNWAAAQGSRTFNLSWGNHVGTAPGSMERFYDNHVQNGWRTVVAAAGNSPGSPMASPARAYNLIAVGSMNDMGTVLWGGDAMSSFSTYIDPSSTHGDREKPELAAPGSNIITLSGASPWLASTNGTSFSSPTVAGITALMMQRNTGLQIWPEAVKAILMATSVHNVEGATRLSERDGAGAVIATQADDVSRHVDGSWGAIPYSCGSPYTMDLTTMPLWANRTARVVIAWDTNPDYWSYSSRPSADIDMQILSPSGSYVTGSASWDNTYEIVEFTPPVTGSYKLRINKFSCAMTPKWLGWAWYQNH